MFSLASFAQGKQLTISGYVKDPGSGETLIGATVYTDDKAYGTVSDEVGHYILSVKPGTYKVVCSSIGFKDAVKEVEVVNASVKLDFELSEDKEVLDAAKVFSTSKRDMLKLPQMGMKSVGVETIKKMPALLGETDVIRVIQMMPGVQSPSEGSTGFSVRGGGVDQNLILMDGAPIYNSGHFLGFFSMFNGDVVKNVKLYKGDFPAKFGEKVASVLEISTSDGNMNRFEGGLSVGLLTSKFNLSGPIVKDKLSFSIAARRSYVDIFFPLLKNYIPSNTKLAFWDINAKLNWVVNDKNRISLSAFSSMDKFGVNLEDMGVTLMVFNYRNNVQSFRWNHVINPKLTYTMTVYNTRYKAGLDADMEQSPFNWKSTIHEPGIRNAFVWHANSNNTVEFGLNGAMYILSPSETYPVGQTVVLETICPPSYGISPKIYISNEQKINKLTLRYGIRYSTYSSVGPTTQFFYDRKTHEKYKEIEYGTMEHIKSYLNGIDPRFSLSWALRDDFSLKGSYARTHQYIQQTSISTSPGVLDAWFAASINVRPLVSDQVSVGFNKNFLNDAIQLSAEAFYKYNDHVVDLKDNPGLVIANKDREGLLREGTSNSYGVELMFEYEFSKINGWLGYTWSKAMYDIPEINGGRPYRSPLNHEHAFNFVFTYNITKRLDASATWIYYSGSPTTYPVGRFQYGDSFIPIYSDRNEDSMPDYHRLDLSVNLKTKGRAEGKRWSGEWNFSIYNAYNRHNAWSISSGFNRAENQMSSSLIYLFAIVPSVAYNLTF